MEDNKNNLSDDQVMVPVVVTIEAARDLGFKMSDIHPWKIGSHTVNVVFVPASKAVHDGYLATWYKQFRQEDRDGRCPIKGKNGKTIRCPDHMKCEECERMKNYSTLTFSDLEDDDDEDSIPVEERIPDNGHVSFADTYMRLLNALVDYVNRIHPEFGIVVYLLGLEYSQNEASEITGIPRQNISYWVKKLRVECEDFFDNLI